MNKYKSTIIILLVIAYLPFETIFAQQVDSPLIRLNRGKMWDSYYYGKVAAPFNNWQRINYGMDWPGFDPEWIGADIGGAASHVTTGGLWIGALDDTSGVITVDDWAMYAGSVSPEPGTKYRIKQHRKRFGADGNHWLLRDPNEAEEVIDTEWEWNPNYIPQWQGDRPLWAHVRRTVRQWGGYKDHDSYSIQEYVITNTHPDSTMHETYLMFTYAFSINSRAWRLLFFPRFSSGSRNNRFIYDVPRRTIYGYAQDLNETAAQNETYMWYPDGGPEGRGEWAAPGYAALRFLYISPNDLGQENRINRVVWSAAEDQIDLYGPFAGIEGYRDRYDILRDPTNASEAVTTFGDSRWGERRMWTLASLGPFTLAPGDSIKVVTAHIVGGIDYKEAINPATTQGVIGSRGVAEVRRLGQLAQNAYDENYRIPKPPAAPEFEVELYEHPTIIGNVISWSDEMEDIPDPDYIGYYTDGREYDLAGYRVYRSDYLPIGPWDIIADIPVGSPGYYSMTNGQYSIIDTTVSLGQSYYYALSAYDTGHDSWPVNPAHRFPETGSNRVPPLETSIFANRTIRPFRATIPARDDLSDIVVVPNPFIMRSGAVTPDDRDVIQFVNLPTPATIRIYTMRGDLVKTIYHTDDSGIAWWNQQTDYGQFAQSGVYIYHIEVPGQGATRGRFAIIR